MSNINIKRAIENIRTGTTVYTPIAEVIVNAIQAIDELGNDGSVDIIIERSKQRKLDNSLSEVENIVIKDDGVGFTAKNRESFDELYSDYKIEQGGKGFGRFTCLKYFKDVTIDSIYLDNDKFKQRTFSMGRKNKIIENEKILSSDKNKTGTIVRLESIRDGRFTDKKLSIIARNLVEKLLPFFIQKDYKCPTITISEQDDSDCIILNKYISTEISKVILEIELSDNTFKLCGNGIEYDFDVRLFKFYSPGNRKSKISLVAHMREVVDTSLYHYIPEFIDEFYEKNQDDNSKGKNYIIKAYVFSTYLDKNVSVERGGFNFKKDGDIIYGISQNDIELAASHIAKTSVGDEIRSRQEKKESVVNEYVRGEAPWHNDILKDIDISKLPYNATKQEIETVIQKERFKQEIAIKNDVQTLLKESNIENLKTYAREIVSKISGKSKNELLHYIALRRSVMDIFEKSLESDEEGKYSSEGVVHDIIFPRKGDSEKTSFENHNLWIIDERLNFTEYVSSDLDLNGVNTDRPDLLVYDKRVLFRGDNERSNPVTIFEFKKPQRDDFVNPSSKEDPVQQIVRYVNAIREGKFKTPKGREILIGDNTPFYGYVICELTQKVKKWLINEKDFKPMPDDLGWFQWRENINLYIEVLGWDKVLKDAQMRNRIFFHKLGI